MKKIFFIIMVFFTIQLSADKVELKYPLTNVVETTQWPLIMKEFEITTKLGHCGTGMKYSLGLKAHMIEFVGYYERSDKPLNFIFVGASLDANPVKANTPYESNDNGDTPKTQVTNSHFIKLPLLGMIFKKKLAFWCLQTGVIEIPYLSEFDMTYKHDYMGMKMIPQMVSMFSPDTLISGVFDCAATETAAVLYGNTEADNMSYNEFEKYSNKNSAMDKASENNNSMSRTDKIKHGTRDIVNGIRNSIYYVDGCNGFSPVGGYQDGNDPIVEGHNDFHGISNILQGASLVTNNEVFKKQSNFSFLPPQGSNKAPSPVDTMCRPAKFAMPIPSQFGLQEVYPVIGKLKEMGQDGISTSTAKNVPGSEGVVFAVWERRDYFAFAYFCPN